MTAQGNALGTPHEQDPPALKGRATRRQGNPKRPTHSSPHPQRFTPPAHEAMLQNIQRAPDQRQPARPTTHNPGKGPRPMGSAQPPDRPSSPEPRPPKPPPSTSAAPSPARNRPQIGIAHLLVWTACVAVYLGLVRTWAGWLESFNPFGGTYSTIKTVLGSLAYGAAVGGLVLWIARRARGLAFPKHPGEYLLVVTGLRLTLHVSHVFLALWIRHSAPDPTSTALPRAMAIGFPVLYSLLVLWPVLALKNRRWRGFFVALLAVQVLRALTFMPILVHFGQRLYILFTLAVGPAVLDIAADAILIVIVFRDHRQRIRYPWTHWLGVAVRLWLAFVKLPVEVSGIYRLTRTLFD